MAAGLLHKSMDHAESQTASFTHILGGEERIESPFNDFRRHAGPVFNNGDQNVIASVQSADQ